MGKAQKPETMSAEVRRICLQSPSTECAASEACNAHHHATLQHSLPLRPRQQAPRHADLRQWQCRVSVQPLTATSDDNVSNLRCWRNAGTYKQSTGPLATLERRYSLKHAWTAKCSTMQTSRLHSGAVPRQLRPICELQMDAPSPGLCFLNELGDVRGLKCSRAFSAFCIFERAI